LENRQAIAKRYEHRLRNIVPAGTPRKHCLFLIPFFARQKGSKGPAAGSLTIHFR
jgi:hypothetical protein